MKNRKRPTEATTIETIETFLTAAREISGAVAVMAETLETLRRRLQEPAPEHVETERLRAQRDRFEASFLEVQEANGRLLRAIAEREVDRQDAFRSGFIAGRDAAARLVSDRSGMVDVAREIRTIFARSRP